MSKNCRTIVIRDFDVLILSKPERSGVLVEFLCRSYEPSTLLETAPLRIAVKPADIYS